MSTHTITLTRSAQTPYVAGNLTGYQFNVVASAGVNMPDEIFMIKQRPLDPIAQTTTNDFVIVCTPSDLQNLPINYPILPNVYFRMSEITVVYPAIADGNDVWAEIQADTLTLCKSLDANDRLVDVETIVING